MKVKKSSLPRGEAVDFSARNFKNAPVPRAALRFGQWLLVAALLSATGAQWLALQSVAWGTMLVDYAQHDGWATAIEKTFDGLHPCALCKSIAQGKKAEKKPEAVVVVVKLNWFHQSQNLVLARPAAPWTWRVESGGCEARFEQPALPPPRSALA